jgi:hypothetical protein
MSLKLQMIGGVLVLLLVGALLVWWQWATLTRVVKGGAAKLREPVITTSSGPVIDHTYGFHPAIWGVSPDGPEGERVFDLAAEVGAPYMRMGFNRKWLNPREGVYEWKITDRAVEQANARGLKLTPSIHLGNNFWAAKPIQNQKGPFSVTSAVPADLTTTWDERTGYSPSVTEFYEALLKRYPNTFPFIAIGNEPNAEKYWAGTYEEYIRVLQTAAQAIHRTDPSVQVIDGGIASEAWGCIAVDRVKSGEWTEKVGVDFIRGYYATTRLGSEMKSATDEQIIAYQDRPEIATECEAREEYFKGLVGHVDAVNFHFYEGFDYLDDVVVYLREKMKANGWEEPVIVTNELGNKQYQNPSYDVEGPQQAHDLRKKVEWVTAEGFPLILWFSVNGEDSITGGFLSTHAKDGTPYEAALEYRRFLEEQAQKD